jgi:hypothetical protein
MSSIFFVASQERRGISRCVTIDPVSPGGNMLRFMDLLAVRSHSNICLEGFYSKLIVRVM